MRLIFSLVSTRDGAASVWWTVPITGTSHLRGMPDREGHSVAKNRHDTNFVTLETARESASTP
jgi:hypothetical protein